ncbi:MAG TPA: hypothetical protein VFT18_01235 [Gaiellaceae bacterium]|nr:hypothetical protein [Gaiellaceae bacterium]
MTRLMLIFAIAALVLPSAALAKGPSAATMEGPGGGAGISFGGDEGSGPLGQLTEQAGFFPAVFGQEPNPMLAGRPKGDLGPKYTITYTVPGGGGEFTVRQDVYPYADPSPVTYLAPGQKVFDLTTRGGWFQAGPDLKTTLVSAGLPASPRAASSSDDASFPTTTVGLLALALLLVLSTGLLLRRRARPAAA